MPSSSVGSGRIDAVVVRWRRVYPIVVRVRGIDAIIVGRSGRIDAVVVRWRRVYPIVVRVRGIDAIVIGREWAYRCRRRPLEACLPRRSPCTGYRCHRHRSEWAYRCRRRPLEACLPHRSPCTGYRCHHRPSQVCLARRHCHLRRHPQRRCHSRRWGHAESKLRSPGTSRQNWRRRLPPTSANVSVSDKTSAPNLIKMCIYIPNVDYPTIFMGIIKAVGRPWGSMRCQCLSKSVRPDSQDFAAR